MSIQQWIEAGRGGPVVVVAGGPSDVAELRGTGERLQAASHPGVVELVSSCGDDSGWQLHVAHGGSPLSATDHLTISRIAAAGASVATTLADLHDLGIVHGRLTQERVLLGRHGHPVICGFGPETPLDATAATDVAALGAILGQLLDDHPADDAHRARRSLLHQTTNARRSIAALVAAACDDEPTRRPTMRRLAASLADLAGRAPTEPATVRSGAPRRAPGEHRRTDPLHSAVVRFAGTAMLAVLAAVMLALVLARFASPDRSSRALAPFASPAQNDTTGSTEAPVLPPCVVGLGSTTTSPGCPHSVALSDNVVTIDGARFTVGRPGDLIVVGSWRCDGDATIAALRRDTGDVFVFPRTVEDVTVSPVANVPGASTFDAVGATSECQRLRVVSPTGDFVTVPMGQL